MARASTREKPPAKAAGEVAAEVPKIEVACRSRGCSRLLILWAGGGCDAGGVAGIVTVMSSLPAMSFVTLRGWDTVFEHRTHGAPIPQSVASPQEPSSTISWSDWASGHGTSRTGGSDSEFKKITPDTGCQSGGKAATRAAAMF